ncbi:ABC-F family ATP-binding cassette domain-containing protein [Furfurilactobacillus siliginis]|uniref:ABC superfamily ATP binding cassette transporter, ABC protein n=1 Tax=Furfurilactobacillus siliginis TaxID=348151 RepID=A0A0R2LB51_9LACO|nr:ABC-F family ATP-binding cassette domain-containing protein [Furfurilactobacillus siliginis]KRN97013.1 ABC superfamily ATP binding cassette transporter, ABC protein [Furfurilactobacillus siliginis]GEK27773.1 ABC transporter ATP-binding protein [Furfurilactobacillus siliginis]
MQTLRAEHLTRTYGEKTLFKDVDFLIGEHDRIGLIGTNGSGKTSLLNTIAGIEPQDDGKFESPNDYRISYLKQIPELDDSLSVLEAVFAGAQPVFATIRRYEQALDAYSNDPTDEALLNRYTKAEAAMNQEDAWLAESNVKTILTQLHITDLTQPVKTLSGGQRKRVGLAQVLIQAPDLLLLDEPTNHLDFDSIAWLEKYVASYPGAVLVVTHDRYFLDAVATRIFELSFGDLFEYQGNYQSFVEQKAVRVEHAVEADRKQNQLYKKELAWMRTSPQARGTKQQARVNHFNDIKDNLNTLQVDDDVDINLGQQRLGKKVIIAEHVDLSLGGHSLLSDFNLLIQGGDRIGITGNNGAGKSSLLNVLAQRIPVDSGTVTIGETVKLAYYTQQTEPIPGDKRMISYLNEVAETVKDKDGNEISTTNLLEQFLFPRFMHGTLIRKLSGGEKRRLYLLKLLMSQPNVLFLDEPTNDLDIGTLTVLEDYLSRFAGTVITVSHDRYFLDKVADQLLIFSGNGVIDRYSGRFSQYLAAQDEAAKAPSVAVKADASTAETASTPAPKKKLTYAEQKEWDVIEAHIDELEEQKQTISNAMTENGADYGKLAELQKQFETTDQALTTAMERWEYLSQFA